MVILTKTAEQVFAGYTAGGAARKIDPAEGQTWGTEIEASIDAQDAEIAAAQLAVTGAIASVSALDARVDGVEDDIATIAGAITSAGTSFITTTVMNGDLSPDDGTLAEVTTDPSLVNNDFLWIKIGATGTGSWSQTTIPSRSHDRRRLDDLEGQPLLRNGFLGNSTDKYDVINLKDSDNKVVFAASQEDGSIRVGAWEHKPSLANHDPYEPGGYPCYISGGDIVVVHDNGQQTINGGDYEFTACGPGKTFVCAAWNKPAMGTTSAVQIDRNGEIFAPYGKSLAIGIMVDAQSNGTGSRAVGVGMSVNPDPDHIFMPDTGYSSDVRLNLNTSSGTAPVLASGAITGLVPMDSVPGEESFTTGQTPVETLCYALHAEVMRKLNYAPTLIGFSLAIGGFALANLVKTTQHYDNMLTAVTDTKAAAWAAGYRFWLPAILWMGGESDAANASYASQMVTHWTNTNTDIKAITGQNSDIMFILVPPSSFAKGQDKAVTAMVDLHRNHPDKFVLSHPSYMVDYDIYSPGVTTDDDYVHRSVRGQQMTGEWAEKTWIKTVFGKTRPDPLMSTGTATLSGLTITIPMLVPVSPMVIDTTTVSERTGTNKGFVFVDDSGSPPTISTVAVSGDNLVLTLSGASTGTPASRFVEVGLEGHDASDPFTFSEMARCNIRDSDTKRAVFDPTLILHNWMMPERIPVVAA